MPSAAPPAPSLPPTAALAPGRGGQDRLLVDAPAGAGEIYLHGAHLTTWVPTGCSEVLFTSRQAVFDGSRAIRGGVPLCLPWFGPGPSGTMTPAHGWARTSRWELRSASSTPDGGVRALLSLTRDSLTALYEVEVGRDLTMTLSLRNDAAAPRIVEAALHSYLALHDVTASRMRGLEGAEFYDNLTGTAGHVQHGELAVDGPVDRIYRSDATVRVTDPGHGRTLVVLGRGSASTVVWNPWAEGAAAFTDMADDEFASMLCVETAAVRADAPVIEPGESWSMQARLAVEPL